MPSRQRRRGRIPALAIRVAADPEGAGEIDDANAALEQLRRELGGGGLGQRQEHDVGLGGQAIDVERRRRRRPRCARAPAAAAARCVAPDDMAAVSVHRGMAREDAHQLLAGVAGGAGNGDAGAGACGVPRSWLRRAVCDGMVAERARLTSSSRSLPSKRKRIFIQVDA